MSFLSGKCATTPLCDIAYTFCTNNGQWIRFIGIWYCPIHSCEDVVFIACLHIYEGQFDLAV